MDIIEAINTRISCRAYTAQAIAESTVAALRDELDAINAESGFNFQLYGPREDGSVIELSASMFSGEPPMYAAFVAKEDPVEEERLGFYGERFVLKATQLGVSNCWVAGTFNRTTTRVELGPDEVLHDVVPLGYPPAKTPLKQKTIRAGIRARSKKPADMWRGDVPFAEAPEWVQAAIEAVEKGPSAINEQPVVFVRDDAGSLIRAELVQVKTGKEYTDLGIAKYHFQQVAASFGIAGTWEWGVGGAFICAG